VAPSSAARVRPSIAAVYSATLLVAIPIPRATSATVSPFGVVMCTPTPAGPGLPRAAPSQATIR
jgi:hypothetical protein